MIFHKALFCIIIISCLITSIIIWAIMFVKCRSCKIRIPIKEYDAKYVLPIFIAFLLIINAVILIKNELSRYYSFTEMVTDNLNMILNISSAAFLIFVNLSFPKAYLTEKGVISVNTFYPRDTVKYSIQKAGNQKFVRLHIKNNKASDPMYVIKNTDLEDALPVLDDLYGWFDGIFAETKRKTYTLRNFIIIIGTVLLLSGSLFAWYKIEKPFVMVGDRLVRTDSEYVLFSDLIFHSYTYADYYKYLPEIEEKFDEIFDAMMTEYSDYTNYYKFTSKDLNDLKDMPNLKHLCMYSIDDLTEIGEVATLEGLYLGGADKFDKPEDFTPLKNLTDLKYFVGLGLNDFNDLTVFENADDLMFFELTYADIQKGLDVIGSKDNLTILWLSRCTADDFSPIGNCKNLKVLYLNDTNVNDLSFLGDLTELEQLNLSSTNAENYSVLLEMPSLKYLASYKSSIPEDILKKLEEKGVEFSLRV